MVVESFEVLAQVSGGVAPLERRGGDVVPFLESEQTPFDGIEIFEIIGREHLALNDREVNLHLVQPRGVLRGMNHHRVRVPGGQPVGRGLSPM